MLDGPLRLSTVKRVSIQPSHWTPATVIPSLMTLMFHAHGANVLMASDIAQQQT